VCGNGEIKTNSTYIVFPLPTMHRITRSFVLYRWIYRWHVRW